MTLRNWHKKFLLYPLFAFLGIMLISQLVYLINSVVEKEQEIERSFTEISKVVSLGVKEKHRVMIELVLSTALTSFDADTVILCRDGKRIFLEGNIYSSCQNIFNRNRFLYKIVEVPFVGMLDYKLIFSIPRFVVYKDFAYLFAISFLLLILVLVFVIFIKNKVEKDLVSPLIKAMANGEIGDTDVVVDEIKDVIKNQNEREEVEKQRHVSGALIKQARQVAHDIRSPLAALKMVVGRLDESDQTTVIIRGVVTRIQDIANNLLQKKVVETKRVQQTSLVESLKEITNEKRIQYSNMKKVSIDSDLSGCSELLVEIDNVAFKQIISNLVNNSVEALEDKRGQVFISLNKIENGAQIIVEDSGKGISQEILQKLEVGGGSYGKENKQNCGFGLGLSHAKEMVAKWGGSLLIDSQLGAGTTVSINLPILV